MRRGFNEPAPGSVCHFWKVINALGVVLLYIYAVVPDAHISVLCPPPWPFSRSPEAPTHADFVGRQYGDFGCLRRENGEGIQHISDLNREHLHPSILTAIQPLPLEEFLDMVAEAVLNGREELDGYVQRAHEDPKCRRCAQRLLRTREGRESRVSKHLKTFFTSLSRRLETQVDVRTRNEQVWSISGGYVNAASNPVSSIPAALAGFADMVLGNPQNRRRATIEIKRPADMRGASLPPEGLGQMIQAGIGHQAQISLLFAGERMAGLFFRYAENGTVQIFGTQNVAQGHSVQVTLGQMMALLVLAFLSSS